MNCRLDEIKRLAEWVDSFSPETKGSFTFETTQELATNCLRLIKAFEEFQKIKPKKAAYGALYYHFNTVNQIKAKTARIIEGKDG